MRQDKIESIKELYIIYDKNTNYQCIDTECNR